MPTKAKLYVSGIIGAGVLTACGPLLHWQSTAVVSFLIYLSVVLIGSVIKLRLPGLTGTYSASFLALLFGLSHFNLSEMIIAGALSGLAQSVLNVKKRPQLVQIAFNISNLVVSVALCFGFVRGAGEIVGGFQPALFCGAAVIFFVVNTVIVSGILALLEGKGLGAVWESWYLWSFAYYLVGSALLGLLTSSIQSAESWLLLVPVAYLIHFYYGLSIRPAGTETADAGIASEPDRKLPRAAHVLIIGAVLAGFTLLTWSVMNWTSQDPGRFVIIFALAALASTLKIRLPGMTGTMSVLFVILLFGVTQLTLSEMLVVSAFSAAVQSLWLAKKRPVAIQVLFNMSSLILSTAAAMATLKVAGDLFNVQALSAALVLATLVLYAVNTLLVATVLCLIDSKPLSGFWQNCCFWSLPYYMVGAVVSGLMVVASRSSQWAAPSMFLAMMGLIYASYRAQVRQAVERTVLP